MSPSPSSPDRPLVTPLPSLPAAILRALLPLAEREEVLADLGEEYRQRLTRDAEPAVRRWLWWQLVNSLPALVRRSWWRGWTGFEPQANRMKPGGPSMESWIMDVRFAARRLTRRPTYALLAILTLALGVGGTAAIFAIARGLLLDPLPVQREEEVVAFWHNGSWSEQEFLHLRGSFPGFASVAAYRPDDVTMQVGDAPARLLPGIAVSSEFFHVLGARSLLGRTIQQGEDADGVEPVAVLSHDAWQDLGSDPAIIGQRLQLDGIQRTVVGVMPPSFWFPDPSVRVWTPAPLRADRRSGQYTFIGRLSPGQSLDAMAAPLARLRTMIDDRFDYPPQWDPTKNMELTPLREFLIGALRPALIATLAAMGVILLIACANVAALMLGQVEGRTTELAVRSALGAERRRLIQQVVAEALLVGAVAGIVGAGLAAGTFRLLAGALPLGAWGEGARPDWGVFGAAMVFAVVASLLVALVPVLSVWRGNLRDVIGRSRTGGIAGRGGRLEGGLVVAEVAMAVLLTAGAALLGRSVVNLYAIDPGVETEGVAVVHLALGSDLDLPRRQQTMRELVAAVAELPGVSAAAVTQKLPLGGGGDNWGISIEGRPDLEQSTTAFRMVSAGYFETMGMTVRRGRDFEPSDRPDGELVVVINEELAKKYFPGVDPLGRRIGSGFDTTYARIVGVVETAAEASLTDEPQPARYMLAEQVPYVSSGQSLVLRVSPPTDAEAILPRAREAVQATARAVAVQETTTMEQIFARAVGPVRQVMTLLALLTALALVLGAVGVYGVISHFASRRQRDWGIRVALGLRPAQVVGHVVGRGAALVAVGVVLGVAGAVVLARLLASLLYGVGAADPMALVAASLTLMLVGIVAAWLPARRAGNVDPAIVLREQ